MKKYILFKNDNYNKEKVGAFNTFDECLERALDYVRDRCSFRDEVDAARKNLVRRGYYCIGYSDIELQIEECDG